jgi:hypothetical protein
LRIELLNKDRRLELIDYVEKERKSRVVDYLLNDLPGEGMEPDPGRDAPPPVPAKTPG